MALSANKPEQKIIYDGHEITIWLNEDDFIAFIDDKPEITTRSETVGRAANKAMRLIERGFYEQKFN